MESFVLLANAAEVSASGAISALGLGWSLTGLPTPPAALVVVMKVPWDQTNKKINFSIELVDADGQPVIAGQDPFGTALPLRIEGEMEVGRPAGIPHGMAIDQLQVFQIGPGLPLNAGHTYEWRLSIDGEPAATRSFYIRPS